MKSGPDEKQKVWQRLGWTSSGQALVTSKYSAPMEKKKLMTETEGSDQGCCLLNHRLFSSSQKYGISPESRIHPFPYPQSHKVTTSQVFDSRRPPL